MELLAVILIIFTGLAALIAFISFIVTFFGKKKEPTKLQKDLRILEKSIADLKKQGLKDDAVVKRLSDAGWDAHVAELVLHDLAEPNHRIEKLQKYTDEQIRKGIEKEALKEMLMDAGWDENIIDLVLRLD